MSKIHKDYIVIGGGISGLLVARELMLAGASVLIVERGRIGQEASWAGGGILSPLYPWRYPDPVNVLARWSQQEYPELCRQLKEQTGIDPEWTQNGMLLLDNSDKQGAERWSEHFSVELNRLEGNALHRCEPALAEKFTSAYWLPDIAQVRNPRLVKSLHAYLMAGGVDFIENCQVTDIMSNSSRVVGVDTSNGRMEAGGVVVAAGAWSAQLNTGGIGVPGISPVKGQMLLFRGRSGLIKRIVLGEERYVIPRRDGRVLVGSTMENVGFDKTLTKDAESSILRFALETIPELATCQLERHWAGLRPGSSTGVPYVGPHPGIEGLFFNTGHYRNGVVMGPASARLLADLILERQPVVDPAPFSVVRDEAI